MWSEDQPVELYVGVRGEIGALSWIDPDEEIFVPTIGLNEDHAGYMIVEGYDFVQSPRSEVPIGLVYQAVTEFFSTHARPTCVE